MVDLISSIDERTPTLDDYQQYFGEDLKAVFGNGAQAFLDRCEMRLASFLKANMGRDVEKQFARLTDKQRTYYKLAVLEQCRYDIQYGTPGGEAGLDIVSLHALNNDIIREKSVSPLAKNYLINAGLWSMSASGPGFFGYDPWLGGWFY